jgi:hypothetical protein
MSAVLDFRELRDKVLAGEDDEVVEETKTPIGEEVGRNQTIASICVSVATFAILGYDKFGNGGQMFTPGITTGLLCVGGVLPLGYALGNMSRGMEAQTEKTRYERLLDDSQGIIEEQQEEMESMEAEAEEEKEAETQQDDYRYDYLSESDSFFHAPALGMGISAFGQEGVPYRPNNTNNLW